MNELAYLLSNHGGLTGPDVIYKRAFIKLSRTDNTDCLLSFNLSKVSCLNTGMELNNKIVC